VNAYFELADCIVDTGAAKYFAAYDVRKSKVIGGVYRTLMLNSNRVWLEEESGVRFLKNRFGNIDTIAVDLEEFFIVKLQSETV
jgi:hypothetical protein